MAQIFQDFIPEGGEAGALSDGGYQDFVPAREPVKQEIEPVVEEVDAPVIVTPVKKVRK